jgi:hypothetical protein
MSTTFDDKKQEEILNRRQCKNTAGNRATGPGNAAIIIVSTEAARLFAVLPF